MNYKDLSDEQRATISKRFHIPKNTELVKMDKHKRPYETIDGKKVYCSIKVWNTIDNGFHNH